MKVTITGIKSRKTLNIIRKDLAWFDLPLGLLTVSGGPGNFVVQVRLADDMYSPVEALDQIVPLLRNLTPAHVANLTWKVSP